jgi:hypothetical protein
MKKTVLILMFFLLYAGVHSQTLSPRLIASAGGSSSVSGGTVSWTMGETNIATFISGTTILSQGIQQPEVDILTGSITGTAFCAGVAVSVPFTAIGYYGGSNVFTAQLSDGSGSFASPVNIGTLTSTVSGTVSATIPANTASGSGYRIRVTANLPNYTGLDNGADITVRPQFTTGEITTTGETICYNASPAAAIGNATDAIGGDNSITYSWRSSADSYAAAISGAATSTYTPAGPLTSSTSYRRYAKDNTCNTTPEVSTGTWTVTVEELAVAGTLSKTPDVTYICQGDDVSASLTAGSGGNGTDELEYRTKTGASWSGWTAYTTGTDISSTGKTGIEVQTRRMASYCSNSDYTTVSWIVDLTNPLAVAKVSGTVTLDPTGNYTLIPADVLSSYSDAGVGVETVSMVPASVSCANLGLLTIIVTVTDYCGNQTIVTPQITVLQGTALLSPWVQGNTSPSANGTAVYSPCTNNGTFYLTTQGVSAPKVDVHDFVYQQLCGNGTVIVRLDDVQNGGWAGVMMRESNAVGSKTVLFKTKLYNPMVLIGVRSTTNGNISNTTQNIPSIHWMKIQRTSSNTFKIYTSYDGTTWIRRYTATVAMNNCINAGFFTENAVSGRTTTTWFDHAEVVGYLKDTEEENTDIINQDLFDVMVYPNPASDHVSISIPENDKKVKVTLINASGLVVETSEFNAMDAEYPISHIKPGMYLLRFERDGMIVNKRLVVL